MIGEAGDEGDLIIFPADQVTDDVDLINCKKLFPEMADAVCFWESCRKQGVDWRDASRSRFARLLEDEEKLDSRQQRSHRRGCDSGDVRRSVRVRTAPREPSSRPR